MATALRFRNRVADTTASTTSPLSLAGALPAGYPSFQLPATAGFPTGKPSRWMVETADGSVWMLFVGTYTTGTPNTLTIDTVLDGSSGPGVSVTIPAGTKRIFNVAGSRDVEKAIVHVTIAGTVNTTSAGIQQALFNSVIYDSHGWWDTTNKRYTPQIPGWYDVVNVPMTTAAGLNTSMIRKNGGSEIYWAATDGNGGVYTRCQSRAFVFCNGSTDYIDFLLYSGVVRTMDAASFAQIVGPIVPGV